MLTLSVDIGTSSTRALLWDTTGRNIGRVRVQRAYAMRTTADGGVEMPAEELLAAVEACLDAALAQAGRRAASIRAVGISSYWHSLLGLDAQGQPLTPIYSWADNRSAAAARRLRTELDEGAIHARTGCVLHPSYYPAKLVWLRETQPQVYRDAAYWVSPSEYLLWQWFGPMARRVSVSMASGTGLLNQARCVWDAETLDALGLPEEKLSPIDGASVGLRGLQEPFAARWPALRDTPWFPAFGDGACSNVGSGCLSPERFAINLGTSGAIRALWEEDAWEQGAGDRDEPIRSPSAKTENRKSKIENPYVPPPAGFWRYRADARRPLIGAAFSDGGNVYAWLRNTLKLPGHAALERHLKAAEPGTHGLIFLPFLAGERSLGWNPDARAALAGLNLDTEPIEIVRAAFEGVVLRFALAAERLRARFPQNREIIASGGAFGKSPALAQMLADALGQPVTLAAEPEASSRGAALLAMEAAGLIPALDGVEARQGATVLPDETRHACYQTLLAAQQTLYERIFHTL